MQITELAPVLIAVIAAVTSVISAVSQRSKTDAERARLQDEITESVLARSKADMDEVRAQLAEVRRENKALRNWAHRLVEQLNGAGIEPAKYEEV